jgi:hypothetical protein
MTVITEAHVAELHAKHKAEIDEMVAAFGAKHAEHVHAEPHLRDVKAEFALKKQFRADILAATARHTAAENALSARIGEDDAAEEPAEPNVFVGRATTNG